MPKSPVVTKASTASPVQVSKDNPTVPTINVKAEDSKNPTTEQKPLAPPARPPLPQDYFSDKHVPPTTTTTTHLAFEPNPFEASFVSGGTNATAGAPETPGGTKLPPLNSIGGVTPNIWGFQSLRTGPLSPAMLSGPTAGNEDYFGSHHGLRGGYPTPNESSLRTGLTPGGGGSMFPAAASPNSQALYNQLQSGGATPATLDFHRTAMTAAAVASERNKMNSSQLNQITSQPQDSAGESSKGHQRNELYAQQHDANDAANGLFMLANQGAANGAVNGYMAPQSAHGQPLHHMSNGSDMHNRNGNSISSASAQSKRNLSEISGHSDDSVNVKPSTRGKGKKAASNGRRKAEEPLKAPNAKKAKVNSAAVMEPEPASDEEIDMSKDQYNADGKKQTDEEKRKNFLERNRYVFSHFHRRQLSHCHIVSIVHSLDIHASVLVLYDLWLTLQSGLPL